jgi:hypothetical protein
VFQYFNFRNPGVVNVFKSEILGVKENYSWKSWGSRRNTARHPGCLGEIQLDILGVKGKYS